MGANRTADEARWTLEILCDHLRYAVEGKVTRLGLEPRTY